LHGSEALARAKAMEPPNPFSFRMLQLYAICMVSFLCSSMVGFDNSLLASLLVMKPFQAEFGAEVVGSRAGVMTSMFNIGGLAAVPFLSIANDRYGRRFGMFTGCFLVVVGTVIQGTSNLTHSLGQYMGGRFIIGFGVSLAACAG
jgi:MFS family permease